MDKHTPEPWRVDTLQTLKVSNVLPNTGEKIHLIHGASLAAIVVARISGDTEPPFDQEEHNARRIVACVNFLAGIPTEKLEYLVSIDNYLRDYYLFPVEE